VTHGARILVVDDEPQILRSLRTTLASHGYDVQTAATGEEALAAVDGRLPDLVVLDLVLPGLSGLDVCRHLRSRSSLPILVLSARGDERDKVAALDLGADDYLTKPFGVNELLARIRAALRRAAGARGPCAVVDAGGLRVDFDRRQVTLDGAEVRLTPTEFDLLKVLVANAGRVLTHGYLLRTVWGPEYEGESQLLRVFIGQLRRKVERDPARPRQILTEPGVGYRFAGGGEESGRAAEGQSGS
jgi:two-component system KDP operon response regulator KdpE